MSTPTITPIATGALLHDFRLPSGKPLILSFTSPLSYRVTGNIAYLGATIGRYANRIANATLFLNNQTYVLPANNGPHTLHGGIEGWSHKQWAGPVPENRGGREAVVFRLTSHHLDQGFPGEVRVSVAYFAELSEAGKVALEMEYEATLVGGAEETVVNMTNHRYFPPA